MQPPWGPGRSSVRHNTHGLQVMLYLHAKLSAKVSVIALGWPCRCGVAGRWDAYFAACMVVLVLRETVGSATLCGRALS